MKKLKSTLGDHLDAYEYFYRAHTLDHEEARAKFAFALLFGLKYTQDIPKAYEIFNELSKKGNPDAHLVIINCIFNNNVPSNIILVHFRVWVSCMLLDYIFL